MEIVDAKGVSWPDASLSPRKVVRFRPPLPVGESARRPFTIFNSLQPVVTHLSTVKRVLAVVFR
jgi:hypothetical protein